MVYTGLVLIAIVGQRCFNVDDPLACYVAATSHWQLFTASACEADLMCLEGAVALNMGLRCAR